MTPTTTKALAEIINAATEILVIRECSVVRQIELVEIAEYMKRALEDARHLERTIGRLARQMDTLRQPEEEG